MQKVINCPICENGKLEIEIKGEEKIITSGRFGSLPYKAYCKSCHRFIKYNVVKEETDND